MHERSLDPVELNIFCSACERLFSCASGLGKGYKPKHGHPWPKQPLRTHCLEQCVQLGRSPILFQLFFLILDQQRSTKPGLWPGQDDRVKVPMDFLFNIFTRYYTLFMKTLLPALRSDGDSRNHAKLSRAMTIRNGRTLFGLTSIRPDFRRNSSARQERDSLLTECVRHGIMSSTSAVQI